MIKDKDFYHVDDFALNLFCPNTNQLSYPNKYITYFKMLHSFHGIEEVYTQSLNRYSMYVCYSILMNSLELDKNILSYENYFYDICNGFIKRNNLNLNMNYIASIWVNLVKIFNLILNLSQTSKSIKSLQKIYIPFKNLNSNVDPSSYFITIPIVITNLDNTESPILFIPYNATSIYSNLLVLSSIKYYTNTPAIHLILFDMETNKITYQLLSISSLTRNHVISLLDKHVVDFSKSNIMNCLICPINPCKPRVIFQNVLPIKYQKKIKTVKLLNVDKE